MKFSKLAAILAITCTSAVSAATYDMPFKGENFSDNEKLHTFDHAVNTSQLHGYDIGAKRYDFNDDRWTSVNTTLDVYNNSPTNDKFTVYNKSIYAMSDGKIVGCWRNAPLNPRPKISGDTDEGKQWLHDLLKQKKIPGGGNMLWVEHADGSKMLYAHMIPGTISSSLCPHNDTSFPANTETSSVAVPLAQQVSIAKGQYLGRVGNSGNSTAPHLHIHLEKNSAGQPIVFNKGISSPVSDNNPYGSWTSFAGNTIPDGSRLLWAPRTVGSQYVRHGFGSERFQGTFTHLADSGFKMSWLDGYTVNNKVYYNMVWKPANLNWRSYVNLTSSSYQYYFDKATDDGYVAVQVDSHQTTGGTRYNVIFEKKSLATLARHGLTYAQHIDAMNQAKNLGMSPVNISVVSSNGERRYTVLYHKTNIGGWTISSSMTSSAYQTKFEQQKEEGKRPVYLNAYMHNGTAYYTAVFAQYPVVASSKAHHGVISSTFQTYFNSYTSDGYLTDVVAGIDGYSAHRFAGLWHKNWVFNFK